MTIAATRAGSTSALNSPYTASNESSTLDVVVGHRVGDVIDLRHHRPKPALYGCTLPVRLMPRYVRRGSRPEKVMIAERFVW